MPNLDAACSLTVPQAPLASCVCRLAPRLCLAALTTAWLATACTPAVDQSPPPNQASTPTTAPAPFITPALAPSVVLWSEREAAAVGDTLQAWTAERDWTLTQAGGAAEGIPDGEVAALVGFEGEGFPPPPAGNVGAVVVLEGSQDLTDVGYFTAGEPGARRDEAGFAAGLLAGYASQTGWVALVGAASDARASAYASGYEIGLRYSCPRCRLLSWSATEVTADDLRANAVDVLLHLPDSPGESVPTAVEDVEAWVVWVDKPPAGLAAGRLAGGVEFHLGPLVLLALQASLDGIPNGSWPYSAANGGIVLPEPDPAAISPGRWRLVQSAWAALASGELALSPDGTP